MERASTVKRRHEERPSRTHEHDGTLHRYNNLNMLPRMHCSKSNASWKAYFVTVSSNTAPRKPRPNPTLPTVPVHYPRPFSTDRPNPVLPCLESTFTANTTVHGISHLDRIPPFRLPEPFPPRPNGGRQPTPENCPATHMPMHRPHIHPTVYSSNIPASHSRTSKIHMMRCAHSIAHPVLLRSLHAYTQQASKQPRPALPLTSPRHPQQTTRSQNNPWSSIAK